MASTQQRSVFSHFAHFLAGVAHLRATPLVFVAEMHPNSRALRNRMAKASRARITVRRFERPLRSVSMKHPVMRTLLDLFLLLFLRRTEKTAQALRKSRGLLLKVVNFQPILPNFFRAPPHPLPKVAPNDGISY